MSRKATCPECSRDMNFTPEYLVDGTNMVCRQCELPKLKHMTNWQLSDAAIGYAEIMAKKASGAVDMGRICTYMHELSNRLRESWLEEKEKDAD